MARVTCGRPSTRGGPSARPSGAREQRPLARRGLDVCLDVWTGEGDGATRYPIAVCQGRQDKR